MQVNVHVDPELADRLERFITSSRLRKVDVVTRALTQYMDKIDPGDLRKISERKLAARRKEAELLRRKKPYERSQRRKNIRDAVMSRRYQSEKEKEQYIAELINAATNDAPEEE